MAVLNDRFFESPIMELPNFLKKNKSLILFLIISHFNENLLVCVSNAVR